MWLHDWNCLFDHCVTNGIWLKDISTTERDSFKANGHYYFAHLAQCLAGRTNDRAGVSEPNDHASGSTDDAFAKTDSVARNRTRGASLSSFQDTLGSSAGSVLSGAFPTVLVKILGLFTVTLENGARSKTKTVIVMEVSAASGALLEHSPHEFL